MSNITLNNQTILAFLIFSKQCQIGVSKKSKKPPKPTETEKNRTENIGLHKSSVGLDIYPNPTETNRKRLIKKII